MVTPIWVLNNSPARCCGVPLPAEAKLNSVFLALANATSSATVLTPSLGWTSNTNGNEEIWMTGTNSVSGLNDMLRNNVAFTAIGPLAASSRV